MICDSKSIKYLHAGIFFMLLMYFCSLIVRSKLIELRPEKDMVDYMKKKRKSGIDKKSLKLTGLAVDEDSSAILVKVCGFRPPDKSA